MTTRTTRQWMLGLAAGAALLVTGIAAAPAMAESDRRDSGRDKRDSNYRGDRSEWREHGRSYWHDRDRYRDHGKDRKHDDDYDRVGIRLSFGTPICPPPRVVTYEERVERICVEPEHYETRCIPAVVETRYDHCGRPYQVVICPARYERVLVPARYETRIVRVACPPPVYDRCDTGPRFSIGGIFRF